jgi:iron-sulfur cluster repair protein YtfE (RIC family)
VDAYKDPTSDFSLRAAASLYHYLKNSMFNHFNDTLKHEYAFNIYVEQQKLSPAEKTALINHILNYYKSALLLNVELLHYYVNKLCRLKGDDESVKKN